MNIAPVKRNFYVACSTCYIVARNHGVADPVRVQLVKSFCLHYIGAHKLKGSAKLIQQMSVCWNDAFHFKRFESMRNIQVDLDLTFSIYIICIGGDF